MIKNYFLLIVLFPILAISQNFQLVKDENPTSGGLYLNCSFREMNEKLYYLFNDQATGNVALYVSDGTTSGTSKVTPNNVSVSSPLIIGGSKIFFYATDGINGKEPWISDGTTAGTHLIKNINTSADNFDFNTYFVSFLSADANKAFFIGNDGINGDELWVTDGTELGTTFVKDIYEGSNGSQIKVSNSMGTNMKNGKLYFFAVNGSGVSTVNGEEPWVSDGTATGTFMLKDIQLGFNPSSQSSNTKHFIDYNDKMYFFASGTAGTGLWSTDGTTTNTVIEYNTGIYRIDEFLIKDNLLYFTHSNGPALYTSNGTAAGTSLLATIPNGQLNNVGTCQMTVANGTLFLRVVSNTVGSELFKLDSTNQIVNVKDIRMGATNGIIGNIYPNRKLLQAYNDKVWFLASDGSLSGALEMWNSDGTATGTIALSPLNGDGGFAGGNGNDYNIFATSFGIFMIYYNVITGAELYIYTTNTLNNGSFTDNIILKVFPNPLDDFVTVTSTETMTKIEVVNILGQMVYTTSVNNTETSLDMTRYATGTYMIRVSVGDKIKIFKVIKK